MTKFTIEDLRDIAYRGSYDDLERDLALQLLASMEQEPVLIVGDDGGDALAYRRLIQNFPSGTKLYAAPQLPQPAVPDELPCGGAEDEYHDGYQDGWNACRAAMLQGAEPVQGWIPCSERMPEFYFSVLATDEHEDMVIALPVCLDAWDRCAFQLSNDDIFIATHWMPLPAAPQQEVKP